jgi:hypothetical protein
MRFRYKLGAVAGAAAVAATLVAVTPAAAMDCVVRNRSTQGAVGASKSSQWALIDVDALLRQCPAISGADLVTIEADLAAANLPLVFVTRSGTTLPDNGHGIVHIDSAYFPIILGVAPGAASCLGGP